ncbi:MAG: glycoside hydrolase family 3 protein [Erysipelothrix sp.]|nr:glycoside hydrolase family 3 protein [Erysipelothrix sp.]
MSDKQLKKQDYDNKIKALIANMSQREKFGQLMMPDFRDWTVNNKVLPLTKVNPEIEKIIADFKLGGVILFRENLVDTKQIVNLTSKMQEAVSNEIPLLITIDQEGGLVTRLQSGTDMPGNMALGASRDLDTTYEVAKAIGSELAVLGININFAPTVDVNSNYKNPVIGIRSFGSDPDLVAAMGVKYIKGMQASKVGAAAKHFPGHGDTETDSHFGLPTVDKSLKEFEDIDIKPFIAATKVDVDMLMTAHIVVPVLDNTKLTAKDGSQMGTPATLSKPILSDYVRNKMGYKGIIITDALNMKAIADNFTEPQAVIKTLKAGADIALMPTIMKKPSDVNKLEAIYQALEKAVINKELLQKDIDKSVERVLRLKFNREIMTNDKTISIKEKIDLANRIVGSQKHKALEKMAASQAITLIKNENNTLPFILSNNKKVLILSSASERANLMQIQLSNIIKNNDLSNVKIKHHLYNPNDNLSKNDKDLILTSDFIVMETKNLDTQAKYPFQVVEYTNLKRIKLAVMSTRNPYDIMFIPEVLANIAVYGSSGYDQTQAGQASLPVNISVGMDVVFGQSNPKGKLPVSISNPNGQDILYDFGHGLSYNSK